MFEEAERDPRLIDRGALNFVVVGGGPTGVELAGALADLVHDTMSGEYHELAVSAAQIHLVDLGATLLGPFSDRAHDYAAKVLGRKGVRLHLGTAVTEVGPGHVVLGDGSRLATRCVVWGGGIMAPPLAAASGLPRGRGGRIEVQADLTVADLPGVYAVGDVANIPGPDGHAHPQLGSVALQSGERGGGQRARRRRGRGARPVPLPRQGHHGHDREGRGHRRGGAAPPRAPRRDRLLRLAGRARLADDRRAQPGRRLHRVGLGLLHSARGPQVLDQPEAARIDWGEDAAPEPAPAAAT